MQSNMGKKRPHVGQETPRVFLATKQSLNVTEAVTKVFSDVDELDMS